VALSRRAPLLLELGAKQYRRSEDTWEEAGQPTAGVTLLLEKHDLIVEILVRKSGELTFAPREAVNPYDNESPDINGDGVQLYVVKGGRASGWMLVPEIGDPTGPVRTRCIEGWDSPRRIDASWRRTNDGYSMRLRIDLSPGNEIPNVIGLGVIVNEKPPGRDRRRGQLVLGGTPGEFVYLRGDREERERLPRFSLRP
jgi:hypothetical protein